MTTANEGTTLFREAIESVGAVSPPSFVDIVNERGHQSLPGIISTTAPTMVRLLEAQCSRRRVFEKDIRTLIRALEATIKPAAVDRNIMENAIRRVFHLHAGEKGYADLPCIGSGLIILCNGPSEEKSRAGFQLWDYASTGYITRDTMVDYLQSVFIIRYDAKPALQERLRVNCAGLAIVTTDTAFRDLGLADKITFEEFHRWMDR